MRQRRGVNQAGETDVAAAADVDPTRTRCLLLPRMHSQEVALVLKQQQAWIRNIGSYSTPVSCLLSEPLR
jgi:hypothetical protein